MEYGESKVLWLVETEYNLTVHAGFGSGRREGTHTVLDFLIMERSYVYCERFVCGCY